jgi:pimeloyl-ACP methyl ester carboxylesterase
MPKIQANGVELHYLSVGYGPNMVLLHGFLGNQAVWHLQMVPQLRRHYRVLTYDLRGHGYSQVTPTGYTAKDLAEDLRCLLDSLGIEKAVVVGHSYGADVGLYFALKYPQRVEKLVALEPGLAALIAERKRDDWEGWSYWVDKLADAGFIVPKEKANDLEYLLEISLNTPKFYGPARGLPRNREPLIKLIRNTTLIRDYEYVGDLTLDSLRAIQTETLLVYGDRSHFLGTFRTVKHLLPNCTPLTLPGGEHFGPLEQPDLLSRHILEFAGTAAACENATVE